MEVTVSFFVLKNNSVTKTIPKNIKRCSMKKIMILVSVIFLMCTGIWFRFHTKECRVVSDLAYDKNKKGDHLVYIREGHELVPFLVLTSDYNGETLLLRKEVLKMNMQINSYEAYYENSFMDDYLNHEYIRQLPDGMPVLESEIKITDEKSLGVSGTGTKSIKRKIFLLAYSEVMEDQNINAASEGTFLRFFEKEEQRIVLKENQKSSYIFRIVFEKGCTVLEGRETADSGTDLIRVETGECCDFFHSGSPPFYTEAPAQCAGKYRMCRCPCESLMTSASTS